MKALIHLTAPGRGDIYLDGVRLEKVMGFSLDCQSGKYSRLLIEYHPEAIEVDGEGIDLGVAE